MANFIMLVGIPGCGKSTLTEKLKAEGYTIHSSDAIRNELDIHDPKKSSLIFDIMHKIPQFFLLKQYKIPKFR